MEKFELEKNIKKDMIDKIQIYFYEEFEMEVGGLAIDMFIDFIMENLGSEIYNMGIRDSMSYIKDRADEMFVLEK